jgi:preprotein translocase subunit SecF
LPFHVAFGLSLGLLFGYIATWALGSALYVKWEMDRQRKKFEEGKVGV